MSAFSVFYFSLSSNLKIVSHGESAMNEYRKVLVFVKHLLTSNKSRTFIVKFIEHKLREIDNG